MAILLASLTLALSAPRGEKDSASGPRIVYLLEGESYPRFSPFNWAPEIDQVKVGTYLIAALDRLIDARQSQQLRQLCMDLYRPMEAEPGWRELGTALPYGYASFWNTNCDRGHAYVYEPPALVTSPRPVLLFVHGSAGNFKAYLYVWKSFADRHGFAIVAPTYGFGNWDHQGGLDTLRRARDWIDRQPTLDSKRVYIAGLSNGGKGVGLIVDREADRYAGVVLISAVAPKRQPGEAAWKSRWRHMPVLMLHGGEDDRVPLTYAQQVARDLESGQAQVCLETYWKENHFLFYSKREEILVRVAAWMDLPDHP
ncbi:MAG: hypothetical protein HS116_20020 [Planctomycetes bacterium]|nr:hypothetical protein [Planctomycetota bacterium]